jgi:hypothetical protein
VPLWQRVAVVIWDNLLPLPLQHAVFNHAPRIAAHLDDLGHRRDRERARGRR